MENCVGCWDVVCCEGGQDVIYSHVSFYTGSSVGCLPFWDFMLFPLFG